MSEDETALILEDLKKKYPTLTDEQLLDIMETGAEKGLVTLPQPAEEKPPTELAPPGFDIVKALKGGEMSIGEAIVLDGYLERKTGKSVRDEIIPLLKETKGGKDAGSDLDKILSDQMKYDLLESFIEARRDRAHAKTQPQTTKEVDIEKAIREIGDKMAEALKTHKLEDEKTRAEERAKLHERRAEEAEAKLTERIKAEEEEKKLEAKLREKISPIQQEVDKRISIIAASLKDVEPDRRKGLILDLGEIINTEVGDEIKSRVVDGLKNAFGEKESLPVMTTPEGKLQVDWYKLGEKGLKILDKFIEKLPVQAPQKVPVKEMPPPKQLPTRPAPPTPTPPQPETKPEPVQPQKAPEQPKQPEIPAPPSQPAETKPKPEPEKPIRTETTKEETKEAEKTQSEPAQSESSESSSIVAAAS